MAEQTERANKKKLLSDKLANYHKNALKLVGEITKM